MGARNKMDKVIANSWLFTHQVDSKIIATLMGHVLNK